MVSATFLITFIICSGVWKRTCVPFSMNTLTGLRAWCKLAIPGMVMTCAEWWGLEINSLIAAVLFSVFDIAAYNIMLVIYTLLYSIPLTIAIVATSKVGNAIGKDNVHQAQQISNIILVLSLSLQLLNSIFIYLLQDFWPYLFTNEEEIITSIKGFLVVFCCYIVIDAFQTAIGGILRGVGKQLYGAFCYVFSYYCIGFPIGLIMAIILDLDAKGLWIGTLCASISCLIILGSYYLYIFDWKYAVEEGRKRRLENSYVEQLTSDETNANEIEMEELCEEAQTEINIKELD